MSRKAAKVRLTVWDPVEYLKTDRDILGYLNAALEETDAALLAAVLGDIARAKGMTAVAEASDLGRESLYKSLSAGGNPRLGTILRVLDSLGLALQAVPKPAAAAKKRRSRA
jgi:probable addiction module antidote protein